jgi:hypothetical protein
MTHRQWLHLGTFCSCLMLSGLVGCGASRVHELPPPHYSIAGVWELNPALSSDADKVLASLQPKPKGPPRGRGPGPAPGSQPAPEVINDPTTDLPPIDISAGGRNLGMAGFGGPMERNVYRPPLDFQTNALVGGQWLKIQQSDTEVTIMNAASTRRYTPGERSVVSVPDGVADQVSGWSGRNYQIFLTPQIGPAEKESYTLSADGQRLVVKIEVASEAGNKAMTVTRTYDRSTRDPASFRQTLEVTLPPTY